MHQNRINILKVNWYKWKFHVIIIFKSNEVYDILVTDPQKPQTDDANYDQLMSIFTKKDVTAHKIPIWMRTAPTEIFQPAF